MSGDACHSTNWAVQELIGTYRDVGLDPEIWPRTAAAIAVELFTRDLGIPWIATCPGHSGRKHSANEFVQLSSYRMAVAFICRLMWRLARASGQKDNKSTRWGGPHGAAPNPQGNPHP